MYTINDAVQYDGFVGRVLTIGNDSTLHVLVRINENTWKVEKWFAMMCKPYLGFLWTFQHAFNIKRNVKNASPVLIPMDIDDYPYVIKLK